MKPDLILPNEATREEVRRLKDVDLKPAGPQRLSDLIEIRADGGWYLRSAPRRDA